MWLSYNSDVKLILRTLSSSFQLMMKIFCQVCCFLSLPDNIVKIILPLPPKICSNTYCTTMFLLGSSAAKQAPKRSYCSRIVATKPVEFHICLYYMGYPQVLGLNNSTKNLSIWASKSGSGLESEHCLNNSWILHCTSLPQRKFIAAQEEVT